MACKIPNPKGCGNNRGVFFSDSGCGSVYFKGVGNKSIKQGVGIDLAEGVHAYDANDAEIDFTYTPTEIEPCDVGNHTITYTARGLGKEFLPTICGKNKLHVPDCNVVTKTVERIITIVKSLPPKIIGAVRTALKVGESFNPMSGVSAVDDNGNPLTVSYKGEYDQIASGEIATFESIGGKSKSLKVSLEPIQEGTPWMDTNVYNEPYKFKASPQLSEEYNAEDNAIVGGTVAWNQLYQYGDFSQVGTWSANNTNWGAVTVSNGEGILTIGSSTGVSLYLSCDVSTIPSGHVLLEMIDIKSPVSNTAKFLYSGVATGMHWVRLTANTYTKFANIVKLTTDRRAVYTYINGNNAVQTGDEYRFKNAMLIDLTAMFGSEIADYIYSLEQSSAGAGVAWFKKLFPKDYYEYNAGELISVEGLESHDTAGFNQLGMANRTLEPISTGNYTSVPNIGEDKYYVGFGANLIARPNYVSDVAISDGNISFKANTTSGYGVAFPIKCLPNTEYYKCVGSFSNVNIIPVFLDGEGNYISRSTSGVANVSFTTPSGCHWILLVMSANAVGNVSVTDICINLSWSGWRNGEYEPYEKHSYPLDNNLTLRGIPKLDSSNNLYYDGDEYASDGSVTRKYGIVDLGTLNWFYHANGYFYTNMNAAAKTAITDLPNAICTKYTGAIRSNVIDAASTKDKVFCMPESTSNYMRIRDSAYTDATAFKTAMSGVYLVYELATPTTETAQGYTNPQSVEPYGTEEYVTDSIVPVGHKTRYMRIAPISGYTEVDTFVSPTTSETDATKYTTQLGQTVYGGTLDVVSGELVVDRAMVTLDGTEAWTWEIANRQAYIAKNDMKRLDDYVGTLISDRFGTIPNAYISTNIRPIGVTGYKITAQYEGQNWLYLRNQAWESRTDFISWLTSNPTTVVYELAQPQTIQLTPQEVTLLSGTNNVWSDGDVTVAYPLNIPQGENFSYPLVGTYEITYETEDQCGNKTTAKRRIIVSTDAEDEDLYGVVCQGKTCYAIVECEEIETFRTVVYEDGTLIINESSNDKSANAAKHGTAKFVHEPMKEDGSNYIFSSSQLPPWTNFWMERELIKRVEIGSKIRPTSTAYWFYILRDCNEMDLTNLDTSRVTDMTYMFGYVGYNLREDTMEYLDLSMFDMSSVKKADRMFNHIFGAKVLDISSWDTSGIESMVGMFGYCDLIETIYASDKFVPPQTTDYSFFMGDSRLVGGKGTRYADEGNYASYSTYARLDNPPSEKGYFTVKE